MSASVSPGSIGDSERLLQLSSTVARWRIKWPANSTNRPLSRSASASVSLPETRGGGVSHLGTCVQRATAVWPGSLTPPGTEGEGSVISVHGCRGSPQSGLGPSPHRGRSGTEGSQEGVNEVVGNGTWHRYESSPVVESDDDGSDHVRNKLNTATGRTIVTWIHK